MLLGVLFSFHLIWTPGRCRWGKPVNLQCPQTCSSWRALWMTRPWTPPNSLVVSSSPSWTWESVKPVWMKWFVQFYSLMMESCSGHFEWLAPCALITERYSIAGIPGDLSVMFLWYSILVWLKHTDTLSLQECIILWSQKWHWWRATQKLKQNQLAKYCWVVRFVDG